MKKHGVQSGASGAQQVRTRSKGHVDINTNENGY